MTEKKDYSLLKHNTFGIDAKCKQYIEVTSEEEASVILPSLFGTPYIIIGGGSNLLLTKDYDGTVLRANIKGIQTKPMGDKVIIRCGSGEVWDDVVAYCVDHDYYGAENLSLIPGEVGASAVQNIGAYGVEVKDIIRTVEAIEIETGKPCIFVTDACHYSYRQSRFKTDWKNKYLITYVTYELSTAFKPHLDYGNIRQALAAKGILEPTARQLRDVIIEIRQAKLPDPKVLGNAGSFFMNPIVTRDVFLKLQLRYPDMPHYAVDDSHEKIPAGWLIEQCGWKGRSSGRAAVHDKQALVLVNKGGATGEDVVRLCRAIQKDVLNKFGIEINPEVNII